MKARTRLVVLALVGLLVGGSLSLVTSAPAEAAEWFPVPANRAYTLDGHGYGHGRGLSQWGAQGAATQGLSANQILDFYYPGTTRTNIGTPTVRVLLSGTSTADLRIDSTAGTPYMYIQDGATGVLAQASAGPFRVLTSGTTQRLLRWDGANWVNYSIGGSGSYAGPLAFWSADGATVWAATGTTARNYRGSISVQRTGSGISSAVNHVNMQEYLSGVVPKESPPSFLAAALQAQSVAARSYAWWDVQTPSAGHYDICDTTACQVYGGRSLWSSGTWTAQEASSTNQAVAATAGTALYYGGAPAFTQFSASNGGASLAGSRPYLRAALDPYDGIPAGNTNHKWTTTLTASYLESTYPSIGTLQGLRIVSRAGLGEWGGHITSLEVVGSKATVTVPSPRFGLKSTWWKPRGGGNPFGNVDSLEPVTGNKVRVTGWAIDPDSWSPLTVHVYIDGVGSGAFLADTSRPDVGAALGRSDLHGYDLVLPVTQGRHEICIYAINVGPGTVDPQLGCRTVDTSGLPVGEIETARIDAGQALITGWTVDPDTTAPLDVHAHVNGAVTGIVSANGPHPGAGAHGFTVRAPVQPGWNEICLFAIDVPTPTTFSRLGCRRVELRIDPVGTLESVTAGARDLTVTGWGLDPETSAPIDVHVYVDGANVAVVTADASRPDVAAAYPDAGDRHGFTRTVPVAPGVHEVCVYAINVLQGSSNPQLGCRTVDVGVLPVGRLDEVSVNGFEVRVRGWALDGDTSDPIDVHFHIDGRWAGMLTASGDRPDVAAAYPAAGAAHGFDARLDIASGQHTVCAYAINVLGKKGDPKISCAEVTVAGGSLPFGQQHPVMTVDGVTTVSGWAIEPDWPIAPVQVHFHVDGRVVGILNAADSRPDVAAAYPGAGPWHGFTGQFVLPKGWHTVCTYAINAGAGRGDPKLGCQVIVVQ